MSPKVTSLVTGLEDVRNAFRLLDAGVQTGVADAIRETTEAIAAGARRRVPVSGPEDRKAKSRPGPGELRDTIRTDYVGSPETTFTGFVKVGFGKLKRRSRATRPKKQHVLTRKQTLARAEREAYRLADTKGVEGLGVYAMVVEYGSPKEGKEPSYFLRYSRQAEMRPHHDRLRAALVKGAQRAGGGA